MASHLSTPLVLCGALIVFTAVACGDDDGDNSGSGGSVGATTNGSGGGAQGGAGGVVTTAAGGNGAGGSTGAGFGGFDPTGGGGMRPCSNELVGVIRDFHSAHPDFEAATGTDKGIVALDLGADFKPVYAGGTAGTTTGQANFDQWFRNVPGVNEAIPLTIALTEMTPGVFTYQNSAFFPIDGQGFGNEGNPHNYHFTFEIHASFEYVGGEVFNFSGDDDVFAFINGKLAIDLGGVHGEENKSVDLDAEAANLGITVGNIYPLDFFFAERHLVESNFRIDTGIACFTEVELPQ